MNEHDLILLDSEQQEIENWVDKDLKAIAIARCCKSVKYGCMSSCKLINDKN